MRLNLLKTACCVAVAAICATGAVASTPEPIKPFSRTFSSDLGNGYYTNPVIYSDFPDPDIIRVDDAYYMLSTSMFYFPGATIMRSYDLVNWEYCANPLKYIENIDDYSLIGGKNRYGHGQWASALQYNENDGKFYLLFNTLEEGAYLMTATDPEGEWTKRRLYHSFYDCGLLFDGDEIYVVCGNTDIWIDRVDQDFNVLQSKKIYSSDKYGALEGSHLYHIGDYYYVYATYCGWPGKQTALRSHDIFGPYEEQLLFDQNAVHQGGLVQTEDGDWYTMLFADRLPWGRLSTMLPVKFVNDWPVLGDNGKMADKFAKPDIDMDGKPKVSIATNDPFRSPELGLQWQWNHNPDNSRWSLTERPDYLRLYTASVTDNIYMARNTLTQRMFGCWDDLSHSYGTFSIDISHMAEGDCAGMVTMQDPHSYAGVKIVNGEKQLFYATASLTGKITNTERVITVLDDDVTTLYMRGVASFSGTGTMQYYYSTDNSRFRKLGDQFTMQYDLSVFVGNRWGIFNYATKALGGYIDVDWFTTEPKFTQEEYYGDFTGFDPEETTVERLEVDPTEVTVLTGSAAAIKIVAYYLDGHTADVTLSAKYSSSNPDVVSATDGRIVGVKDGNATVTAAFTDASGKTTKATIKVHSTTFPLVSGFFNPSIYADGKFNEATHGVTTGQYGFAGWKYDSGVDLSGYKYLVAKVQTPNGANGLSFRIFDENNYWAGAAESNLASGQSHMMFDLHNTRKADNSRKIDPSHIYYVGFWTFGNKEFIIDEVYVTNDDNYLDPSDALTLIGADDDACADVYNLQGVMVRRNMPRNLLHTLPAGLYLHGSRKVIVR